MLFEDGFSTFLLMYQNIQNISDIHQILIINTIKREGVLKNLLIKGCLDSFTRLTYFFGLTLYFCNKMLVYNITPYIPTFTPFL